jgi:hypothetical protein
MPRARKKIRRKEIQRSKKGHRKKRCVPAQQEGPAASFQSKRRMTDAGSLNATK